MLLSSALTDAGRKREVNEDCYLFNPTHDLYLLSDGMGGHAAGEVASHLTVKTVDEFVALISQSHEVTWPFGYNVRLAYEHNVLKTAVMLSHSRVRQTASQTEQYVGMGATLVAVWVRGTRAYYCHVGDSRLYLFRGGHLRQLTADHTLVQEQVEGGLITAEQARVHPLRHVVTRAIGGRDPLEVNAEERELLNEDQLLLCSDGLTDRVSDEEICRTLGSPAAAEQVCRRLIDAANQAGGDDNVTVVLLKYLSDEATRSGHHQ
jgi:PPM family protein phosphatase